MRKLKGLLLLALLIALLVWAGYGSKVGEIVSGIFAFAVIYLIFRFLRI